MPPAADRPETESSWNDPRRMITYALAAGPRAGWKATEGTRTAAEVDGYHGYGDAVVVTYTRGTGSACQTVVCVFRPIVTPNAPAEFLRLVAAEIDGDGERSRPWGHVMAALTAAPLRARRGVKGSRPRRRTGARG